MVLCPSCLLCTHISVQVDGSPLTLPAKYKDDFLSLKSRRGHSVVLPHDFYMHKFSEKGGLKDDQKSTALKMNVRLHLHAPFA